MEQFFSLVDKADLLALDRSRENKRLRQKLAPALVELLFPGRSFLEKNHGISWVYEGFRKRAQWFETNILKEEEAKEAMLFLGLLPFPGQWQWLETLIRKFPDHPEVSGFLNREKKIIFRKLAKKNLAKLKIRSFCQVLKAPNMPGEKGVLRIFSRPYIFYTCPELLKEISKDYLFYVEPAAGINFRHAWMRGYSFFDDPVLFGVGGQEDADFLSSQPGILTTPLAHGDYLETDSIKGIQETKAVNGKKYDIIFNNTFDEMDRKRHTLMLELLTHPLLKEITVLFLGRGSEKNVNQFKKQIQHQGLDNRVTVIANIMRRKVPELLAQCRAGVHLALQENGCRAVYEYFRANLPCVMSKVTAGMNPEIINPRTGILVSDEHLPEALATVLADTKPYDPANWFREHSGSIHATSALNTRLKKLFHHLGYTWSEDIVELTSSGPGRYAKQADREYFSPQFQDLEKRLLLPLKRIIQAGL